MAREHFLKSMEKFDISVERARARSQHRLDRTRGSEKRREEKREGRVGGERVCVSENQKQSKGKKRRHVC